MMCLDHVELACEYDIRLRARLCVCVCVCVLLHLHCMCMSKFNTRRADNAIYDNLGDGQWGKTCRSSNSDRALNFSILANVFRLCSKVFGAWFRFTPCWYDKTSAKKSKHEHANSVHVCWILIMQCNTILQDQVSWSKWQQQKMFLQNKSFY